MTAFTLAPSPTAYAWQAIEYVISQSWALAEGKAADYSGKMSTLSSYIDTKIADANLAMTPANVTTDVAVTEPNVLIPYEAAGIDMTFYSAMVNDSIDKLSGLFATYITTYFPVDNVTNQYAEEWMQGALTTGGTGINQTLELQFWENDRSRILADTARAEDDLTGTFLAKRFPLPPGALAGGLAKIQAASLAELSKSSREIAQKQAMMEQANVHFAVESAIKLRQVALTTAGDYIKSLASSITVAQNLAVSQADAQNGLINAASNFLNARINAKELLLKRDTADSNYEQEANKANFQGDLSLIEEKVKSLVAEAGAVAHMAAAALNNLHANVSGSQGNSESGSVSYSYAGDANADVTPRSWV